MLPGDNSANEYELKDIVIVVGEICIKSINQSKIKKIDKEIYRLGKALSLNCRI